MCEKWEFGCGHSAETHCPAYKNRILTETNGEDTGTGGAGGDNNDDDNDDDDDDPFTDTGTHLSRNNSTQDHLARARSYSTPNRPPRFLLPSSTSSSMTSDTDASSSTSSLRRRGGIVGGGGGYGPGPAVRNPGGSSSVMRRRLSVLPAGKIKVCGGPGRDKKRTDDPCYDCILRRAKDNSAFQRNERAAETRLYNEVGRQANYIGGGGGGGVDRRGGGGGGGGGSNNTGIILGSERDGNFSRSYGRGRPAYANNPIDVGRGIPPRDPQRGYTAPNSHARGGHNNRAPVSTLGAAATNTATASAYYFQPQAPNHIFDPAAGYQDSGARPTMLNPNATAYQTGGLPAQYAPQTNQHQPPQQTPYQLPFDPSLASAPSPYQQYLYPQMEMPPPLAFQGEGTYDGFPYSGMQQQQPPGYGYF